MRSASPRVRDYFWITVITVGAITVLGGGLLYALLVLTGRELPKLFVDVASLLSGLVNYVLLIIVLRTHQKQRETEGYLRQIIREELGKDA